MLSVKDKAPCPAVNTSVAAISRYRPLRMKQNVHVIKSSVQLSLVADHHRMWVRDGGLLLVCWKVAGIFQLSKCEHYAGVR